MTIDHRPLTIVANCANKHIKWLIVLIAYSLFTIHHSQAAVADSTKTKQPKPKKPSTLNDTWYLNAEPEKRYVIDSSIFNIEQYNPIQKDGGIEYTNTGNLGGAAFPLVFSVDRKTGFNTGYNQFDVYRYQKDSVKYYQVIRPYTELLMVIGLRQEQMFRGRFANQHKNVLFYGVDFTRMYSRGTYINQRNNANSFNLYGIYNSKNQHWNVQADLIFNSFKAQENGGVINDIFDSSLFQNTLAQVRLQEAENNYRQTDFYLKTSYNIGKHYTQRIDDTTTVRKLLPIFKISYQFNIEKNRNKFRDYSPDSIYGRFFLEDSVFNDLDYLKTGNAFMLEYRWRKLTSDSTYEEKSFVVNAEAGYDYYFLQQNKLKNNFGNLYVGGTIRSNPLAKLKLLYRATVKYFPLGWNQNDLYIDGLAGYDFEKWGMLTANATYQLKEVPYIYERYTSHPYNWGYNFDKSNTLALGGRYLNPNWGIVFDANYYFLNNLPVFPDSSNPFYNGGKQQNFTVIHAGQRNGIVGLHLENEIWLTIPGGRGTMTDLYSFIYTKHSIFYETRVFKKALWFSTGFDARFRYWNNPPAYDPLLGAFYPVTTNSPLTAQLDWFLNLKIRTVRVFLKVDNIVSAIQRKGYYSLYRYPAADLSFKFGINWRFFE